jgi:L-ascorbate metabolism protein UlaG (beta-lactamase superfamily)
MGVEVHFDPFQISAEAHDADLICITHAHYDHFDPESILRAF